MTNTTYSPHSITQLFVAILLVAVVYGCSQNKIPDEKLQQAFSFHKESIRLRSQVAEQLEQLKANDDSIFVVTYGPEFDSLYQMLDAWDENLIEVPGFEEEHDHSHHDQEGHGHSHDHGNAPKLTYAQHLAVQKDLLSQIQAIEQRVKAINK